MEYQKIKFGNVDIEGKDRYPEYRLVFPEKPIDKTILDVGCNLGFYCFMAHSEGAKRCLGIDNHSAFIMTANSIKERLKYYKMIQSAIPALDFIQTDVLNDYNYGTFDVVLLLYVVHHFTKIEDAEIVIRKCYDMANEVAIFGVLNPTESVSFQWLINRKGNKKLALADKYFTDLFPNNKIEVIYSTVDERSIIKIWK